MPLKYLIQAKLDKVDIKLWDNTDNKNDNILVP